MIQKVEGCIDKHLLMQIEGYLKKQLFPNYFHSYAHYLSASGISTVQPTYFIAYNENKIVGLALLVTHQASGIIKPFTKRAVIYDEPLTDSESVQMDLIKSVLDYVSKKHLFLQFRINDIQHPVLNGYNGTFKKTAYLNVFIENAGGDNAWKALSRAKRWQIRKSIQHGASINEYTSSTDFDQWFVILKNLYEHKIKKPVPPQSFFKALLSNESGVNACKLLVVKYNNQVIGGILLPLSGKIVVHEWYICGDDEKYKSKNIFPSVMATWAAIDYMVQNNFERFDFMGAGRPDIPYGVRAFKQRFGGELVNVVRYTHFPSNIYSKMFQQFHWV